MTESSLIAARAQVVTDLSVQPTMPHSLFAGGLSSEASDDQRAIAAWLLARAGRSTHTQAAYQRESMRLWVWMQEHNKTFATLRLDDIHQFFAHLQQPPAHWIRPRKPRQDEALLATQLLIGPLSDQSLDYSRRVLGLLFSYLHDAGYIARQLIKLSLRPPVQQQTTPNKWLSVEGWHWLQDWLDAQPRQTAAAERRYRRDRWLLLLLYQTGMRREEVAQARMCDVQPQQYGHVLQVLGKGRKPRTITLHQQVLDALADYRAWLGILPTLPVPNDQMPLVCALSQQGGFKPLTPRAIGLIIQQIGQAAAQDCPDPHLQQRLAQMSTHWLRHTNATHRLLAGASLETTQDELGHRDPKTTRLYAKTLDQQRRADLERFAALSQSQREPD